MDQVYIFRTGPYVEEENEETGNNGSIYRLTPRTGTKGILTLRCLTYGETLWLFDGVLTHQEALDLTRVSGSGTIADDGLTIPAILAAGDNPASLRVDSNLGELTVFAYFQEIPGMITISEC